MKYRKYRYGGKRVPGMFAQMGKENLEEQDRERMENLAKQGQPKGTKGALEEANRRVEPFVLNRYYGKTRANKFKSNVYKNRMNRIARYEENKRKMEQDMMMQLKIQNDELVKQNELLKTKIEKDDLINSARNVRMMPGAQNSPKRYGGSNKRRKQIIVSSTNNMMRMGGGILPFSKKR
tara:strand:- start:62 stop:598 length:537 start_codon:yes stop_codon:yes gene_type:complete